MGLFTKRPYDVSNLNSAEKAAAQAALEVAQMLDTRGAMKKDLKGAMTGLRKGKMTRNDLATTVACLVASLAALAGSDDPDRSSILNQKKVATVAMAMALDKLKAKL